MYFNDPDIKPTTSLTSKQLMQFSQQIADGMSYLCSIKVREESLIHLFLKYFERQNIHSNRVSE